MILPPEAVPPRVAAISWAVIRGAGTVREVAAACDLTYQKQVLRLLREARVDGLIDFEDHRKGTLRPLLEVVAFTPPEHSHATKGTRDEQPTKRRRTPQPG